MSNKVLTAMAEIIDGADGVVLFVNQRPYKLSDPSLPTKKGVAFVKAQLNALVNTEEAVED